MPKVAMKDDGPIKPQKPSRVRKWIMRLLFGVVGLIVLFIGLIALSIWLDGVFGRKATRYTNTTYTGEGGVELNAYITQPPNASGKNPAIIMFHEWWGLNDDITTLADALAGEGYVVLAPDAYRGQTTRWIPRAVWLVTQTDEEQISADMDAGFDYLTSLPNVDAERVGTVGFCFGGRQSFNLAQRQQQDLDAVVSLYGTTYDKRKDLEAFAEDVPLLAIYGEEDQSISADAAREMDVLMDEVGLDHQVSIYPGVGHAFVTDENYDEASAAGDAWAELVNFFAVHLKSAEATIHTSSLARSPFSTTTIANNTPQFMCLISH